MTDLIPDLPLEERIAALAIRPGRPIVISDADEVLFAFMATLEPYLGARGLAFDWESHRLNGNIRDATSGAALEREAVRDVLLAFFADHTEAMPAVTGAAAALAAISARAQVVILSNLPAAQHAARRRALVRDGMDYPLLTNEGEKGPAVRALQAGAAAPAIFIDDLGHHHRSVRAACEDVLCLHFIADARLSALVPATEHSHHRPADWPEMQRLIEAHLSARGY